MSEHAHGTDLSATVEHYCGAAHIGVNPAADAGPTLHYKDHQTEIHKVVVGDYENNVFIVRCRDTGDAVLIDAANEHDRLLELSRNLGVRTVIETHGHHDHIGAVTEMRNAGYNVHVTSEDAHMLPSYDQLIENEQVFEIGKLRLRSIKTPGHTDGSVSFELLGSPVFFTGDTLFPGGPGATKFGGDFATIITTIDELMFSPFSPDTIVMPGHGDDTTIGIERPSLQEWIDRGW
jgi:glyoxylase-like metal-dependent hydrolase (beta-lactamase superfamily II)